MAAGRRRQTDLRVEIDTRGQTGNIEDGILYHQQISASDVSVSAKSAFTTPKSIFFGLL